MGSMGLTKPTEGGSSGVWDTLLNALIDLVEEHDHTSGKGVLIPTAGLSIDADKDWSDHKITNLQAIRFNGGETSVTAYTKGLSVKTDNELYWTTSGGTEVKLTNGASLNMSLAGGITGDYTTTDADCEYSDSLKAYKFLQDESPDHYAKIRSSDHALFQNSAGVTNAVTLKSPNSLAASYDVTFPAAVPGSTALLQLSSAGVMTASNTVANQLNADGGARFKSSGAGSTVLAHFEEGSFTPVLKVDGSSQTLSNSYGRFQRIGNWVYFQLWGVFEKSGAVAGKTFQFDGLPYTAESDANVDCYAATIGVFDADNCPANVPFAAIMDNTTGGYIRDADGTTALWDFSDATEYQASISGAYKIAT